MNLNINLTFTVPNVGEVRCVGTIEDTDAAAAGNPAAMFGQWLASIDPAELEAETLNSSDFSTGPTATMLAILSKWASGSH